MAGIAPTMSIAHKGAVVGAKVMGRFGCRLAHSTGTVGLSQKAIRAGHQRTQIFSLLPEGAEPPVDLNKDIMDKYRPAMRKFYLNKKAQFK